MCTHPFVPLTESSSTPGNRETALGDKETQEKEREREREREQHSRCKPFLIIIVKLKGHWVKYTQHMIYT